MLDLPKKCYIVNRQTTPDGKSLAISWFGGDTRLTVTEFERLPTQVWIIDEGDNTHQALCPLTDPTKGAFPDYRDALKVVDTHDKWLWAISGSDDTYVIQDWLHQVFWCIPDVQVRQIVFTLSGPEAKNQYWKLIAVD